jgi:hypothetical protein
MAGKNNDFLLFGKQQEILHLYIYIFRSSEVSLASDAVWWK